MRVTLPWRVITIAFGVIKGVEPQGDVGAEALLVSGGQTGQELMAHCGQAAWVGRRRCGAMLGVEGRVIAGGEERLPGQRDWEMRSSMAG